ncbi:MAG: hypothetical protein AAFQ62_06355 [Pseudomonadota bacterium]
MNSQIFTVRNFSLTAISALAVVLWQTGLYFGAMILLLVTAGIAIARPSIRDQRLILDGTPVLLMFAVMFVAASGMVYAVETVGGLFESDASTECTAETNLAARSVLIDPVN